MHLGSQKYVPCLRWKQGEYQALTRLSLEARRLIVPLIEVAEVGFDFETRTESKSLDEHLAPFAGRMMKKWGAQDCFVDLHHIDASRRMQNGEHPVSFVFGDLRSHGLHAIPVTSLRQDREWQKRIRQIIHMDHRGVCLRISLEEAADPDRSRLIPDLLSSVGAVVEESDLLIDDGAPNYEPAEGFVGLLEAVIRNLPSLERWRSFVLTGCSIPQSLSVVGTGAKKIPRGEWMTYKLLVPRLQKSGLRVPSFGDYAINHPDVPHLDPRVLKPAANIRYTIGDAWYIVRGKNVKDYGLAQHQDLCRQLVESTFFCGEGFSAGDKYITDCANGLVSHGNLTTWRWVGTNHHIEMVARDVANFVAS